MSTSTAGNIAPTGTVPTGIDPRGPRFVATLTVVFLAAALLTPPRAALTITSLQAIMFALGAVRGIQHTPQSWLFRTLIRPRLAPPTELEDPAPPRFAQGVGLVFTLVAVVGFVAGATLLAQIALGFALMAAVLNAVFQFCLGCEMYILVPRWSSKSRSDRVDTA